MHFQDDDHFSLFEYGSITIVSHDKTERQVALKICMPCCVMQAVLPVASGHGIVNNYSIRNPIAIWMPTLSQDRFNPAFINQHPSLHNITNNEVKKILSTVLSTFTDISKIVNVPTDLTAMLPLGTYVIFQFRAKVDNIGKILMELDNVELPGVAEFRFTLAAALARALNLIA